MKKSGVNRLSIRLFPLVLLALLIGTAGISLLSDADAADSHGAPGADGAPPPMPVKVQIVEETVTQIWSDYSGRLVAVDYVELRPQVSGTIHEIRFEDGQDVKKDDILYVIDPGPYEAAVASANADLAAAKSQSDFAQKQLDRAKGLMETNAISKDLLDERSNAARVAKNNIDVAAAKVKNAKIDLDRAHVKAPIAGRVGRAEITEGNLVQSGPNAPILTTILSNSEIYADFDVDEATYLQHIRGKANGIAGEREIPVKLTVRGDIDKEYEGTIHSFDNTINTATGTIRARALFKNEDGALLPGMFVSVRMGGPVAEKKILIPEDIVGTDQDRKFVYVVGPDNKVQYREVKLGATMDGRRVVLSGVKAGENIITEGILRIRPDMMVDPQVATATAEAPAAAKDIGAPPETKDAQASEPLIPAQEETKE